MISATIAHDEMSKEPSLVERFQPYTTAFNQKVSVVQQLHRWIQTVVERLGLVLDYTIKLEGQANKHHYRLKCPKLGKIFLEAKFQTCGPLGGYTAQVQSPNSIREFNHFLTEVGSIIGNSRGSVIMDLMRQLTICNESQFLVECCVTSDFSFLILDSGRLRQSMEITVNH